MIKRTFVLNIIQVLTTRKLLVLEAVYWNNYNYMDVQHADYVGSYPAVNKCPKDSKPEYAFIGRSNVGKSSLINMLCGRKNMARVSKSPGKTQSLNYYIINKTWYLVDLPGYGYAKVSKSMRHKWEKMIEGFLLMRPQLQCAFQLIDINIPPQKIDLDFINWMGKMQVPFVIIYTKTDRLKPEELEANLERFRGAMLESWNALPQQFITSSNERSGRQEILQFIEDVNKEFYSTYETT